uniref:Uncharacterized protein n=1 Tax=Anguilla anguilla TaxID=7936 RepID=A0A0E9WHT1_ANGAN
MNVLQECQRPISPPKSLFITEEIFFFFNFQLLFPPSTFSVLECEWIHRLVY